MTLRASARAMAVGFAAFPVLCPERSSAEVVDVCKLSQQLAALFDKIGVIPSSHPQLRLYPNKGNRHPSENTAFLKFSKSGRAPEVAGRLAIQAAAHALEKVNGGKGMLLGGVPGVLPAKVVIIGGGVVGTHAAHIAMGMGADTWAIDRSAEALKALWRQFGRPLDTVYSTRTAIERHVTDADVVIGGVLIPGAAAPKLVTADMVRRMKPGSVVVDVAIDQGGCFETSHPTTHSDPTYIVDDVVHYCVANMPGAVPRTSTYALNNATLPHVLTLANKGYRQALTDDPHLLNGLNVHAGEVTCKEVADALGYPYRAPLEAMAA